MDFAHLPYLVADGQQGDGYDDEDGEDEVEEYHCCPYNPVIQRIAHTHTILNVVGDSCPREATYCHSGTAVLPEQRQHVPKALFSR